MNRRFVKQFSEMGQPATFLTGTVAIILVLAVFKILSYLFVPVAFAVFLTYIFYPVISFLTKRRVPQFFAVLFVTSVVLLFAYFTSILVSASLSSVSEKGDFYLQRLEEILTSILTPFNYSLSEFLKLVRMQFNTNIESTIGSVLSSGVIQQLLSALSGTFNAMIMTLLFFVFMISGKNQFDKKVKVYLSAGSAGNKPLLLTIESQIQKYLIIKTVISFILAVLITLIYLWFGVDIAIFWGIITFVFNYIPNIGAVFSTFLPIVLILLQFGFSFEALFLILATVGLHFLSGNVVEPVYVGKYLDLSPVFVLFSLFLWGYIWGLPGMFLSVPIAAMIKIVFENTEPLKKYAPFLGGKLRVDE